MKLFRTAILIDFGIYIILFFSLWLMINSLLFSQNFTRDEYNYFLNGKDILRTFRWDTQLIRNHPPLTFYQHGLISYFFPKENLYKELAYARFSMLPNYIFLFLSLFYFTKKHFGAKAGLFSLILLAFNPEILAHGRLITTDLTLALFIFLFTLCFFEFLEKPEKKNILKTALFLGLTLLSKYSALLLIPIALVSLFVYNCFFGRKKLIYKRTWTFFVIILMAVFIVNLGYGFSQSFLLPEKYESRFFQRLSEIPLVINFWRLLPQPYIQGVDWQLNEAAKPWVYGNFFMGEWSGYGFKSFFVLTFIFKSPIPLLIFLLILPYIIIFSKKEKLFLDFLILFTVFSFFFYFSFLSNLNIGFRYVLMIYPLLCFWVGRIVNQKFQKAIFNSSWYLGLIILLAWYIVGTLKIHPYYLAYANELIGGPKNAWKYWADSTLDWGQDNVTAQEYFRKHPEIQVDPQRPTAGRVAVSVQSLNLVHYDDYLWLRQLKKEPINHINYIWLIFEVTNEDLEKIY